LKITGREWEAFLDDFQQTLEKFAVPAPDQGELKAIVNSTRSDIVVPGAAAAWRSNRIVKQNDGVTRITHLSPAFGLTLPASGVVRYSFRHHV
jgi:hypothetical protein